MTIYDFKLTDINGKTVDLADLKGHVFMIVNTAPKCGVVDKQYKSLVSTYEHYKDKGFTIIDIPCNQFYNMAPGTDAEICEFRMGKYNASFPQIQKCEVNGPNELPLFRWLKDHTTFGGFGEGKEAEFMDKVAKKYDPDYKNNSEIKWNFTKFIIDKDGNVAKRFELTDDLDAVDAFIGTLL